MVFNRLAAAFVSAVVVIASSASGQAGLAAGDKAPSLAGKVTWLKGDATTEFEPGKVYVLDFWATWCGPCIAMMPHMNEIAAKHKDDGLVVIGVAIWPKPGMVPTADWLKTKPDRVRYAIAEDVNGAAAAAFMDPIGAQSIPTVMIIDREGRFAWSGHPSEMDNVLSEVLAGTYDLEALKKLEEANALAAQGDWDGAFEIVDGVIEKNPKQFGELAAMKYMVLRFRLEREDEAKAYGDKIIDGVISDNVKALNLLGWQIASMPAAANRDLDFALKAAERASKLTKDADPSVLDTLAKVHFERGDREKAVEIQRKAVDLTTDPMQKPEFEERLREYEGKEERQGTVDR